MDGRTHWEGCWREHLDCAVARVEELETTKDLNCPGCGAHLSVAAVLVVPDEQVMSFEITTESQYFAAKTIGGSLSNMDGLMRAIAKQFGEKVGVVVKSMNYTGQKFSADLLILKAKGDAARRDGERGVRDD